jgi:hypothetical protein
MEEKRMVNNSILVDIGPLEAGNVVVVEQNGKMPCSRCGNSISLFAGV